MSVPPVLRWTENEEARTARWHSERGAPPPARVVVADDTMTGDVAQVLTTQGTGLLWRGDFQNARQLLVALATRIDRPPRRPRKKAAPTTPADAFNQVRLARSQRARTLGMVLIPLDADYNIPLRRAPDMRQASNEVWGPSDGPSVASLRELLGLVGAHEWRVKGIEIAAIGGRIHPHYGVFTPIRSEYIDLVAKAPLPVFTASNVRAFDIGTGTGVLAAVLARRGIKHIVAIDQDARALTCARDNIARLGLAKQIEVVAADLFPAGRAALVVCNPPWIPARPSSPIEHGIYDHESRMLQGFLRGLPAHLEPGGEGWLIMSDIAEHLGLRSREALLAAIDAAGLNVVDRTDVRPQHPKVADESDPLHAARAAEVTSLWRLAARS
ncbi:MAG: class I SAM-dependent methyltransferase [Betaproteobacteria bacterium]